MSRPLNYRDIRKIALWSTFKIISNQAKCSHDFKNDFIQDLLNGPYSDILMEGGGAMKIVLLHTDFICVGCLNIDML